MLNAVKMVTGFIAGSCGSVVVEKTCKAVMPQADTIAMKIVQTVGVISAGCAVNYATQKYVDELFDSCGKVANAVKQATKKEDCVVE